MVGEEMGIKSGTSVQTFGQYVGQKCRPTNFCHRAQMLSILSKEYFCLTNFCLKHWVGVIHVLQYFEQELI